MWWGIKSADIFPINQTVLIYFLSNQKSADIFHINQNTPIYFLSIKTRGLLSLIIGSTVHKKRHFIIQERFYKLIYDINTIKNLWYLTPSRISVSLLYLNLIKNEMVLYPISELMLPKFIQRYDKKIIPFLIHFKN